MGRQVKGKPGEKGQAAMQDRSVAAADKRRDVPALVAGLALAAVLSVVYLLTLLPGVDAGDSAELQFVSPILGVCHPPGYQIEVCFGKLFSMLPVGASIAWRINFMMAVAGVIGCAALYGAVRRVTGSILAGVTAGATLGFSSIYWSHCLVAEAYVFYGAFLALGVYAAVRFVESDRAGWLFLTAVLVGVAVGDRASELFVLPGFLLLWIAVRKKVHLPVKRLAVAVLLFVLPFVFSVSYYLVRHQPENLHYRDSSLRWEIRKNKLLTRLPGGYVGVKHAVKQCLGMTYTNQAKFDGERVRADVDKYAWLLSGAGAQGERYATGDGRNREQGRGASIGLLGILVALIGLVAARRQWGWMLLGAGMFAGNLVFILWHHRWDNLTFVVPGLIGLALLVGLGAAGPVISTGKVVPGKGWLIYRIACLLVPLFLLVSNYTQLDRSTEQEQKRLEYHQRVARAPFPQNSVVLATYWPGMTYRYLFLIEAGRRDMRIMYEDRKYWGAIIEYFAERNQPIYLAANSVGAQQRKQLLSGTRRELAQVGFVRLNPQRGGR